MGEKKGQSHTWNSRLEKKIIIRKENKINNWKREWRQGGGEKKEKKKKKKKKRKKGQSYLRFLVGEGKKNKKNKKQRRLTKREWRQGGGKKIEREGPIIPKIVGWRREKKKKQRRLIYRESDKKKRERSWIFTIELWRGKNKEGEWWVMRALWEAARGRWEH